MVQPRRTSSTPPNGMAAPAAAPRVRLLLGGDTMLGRGVNEVILREGPAYPLDPLVTLTRGADLFFANLECAISPRQITYSGPPKAFYFRADPPAAGTLTHAGVDLVSLANNHALDADVQGLEDTEAILARAGIAYVGAGQGIREASRPALLEAKGMRLGVLAYCDHQKDFAASEGRPGIRYADLFDAATREMLAGEVKALAAQVDHVIVALHWQPNWVYEIHPVHRRLARRLIEAGARVIWGHSPHHFQGVEWIDGSVVLYSTGDLVDDYALEPEFRNDRQLLFEVELEADRVRRVRGYPVELDFARTRPADAGVAEWIERRFAYMCQQVGSRVVSGEGWVETVPAN